MAVCSGPSLWVRSESTARLRLLLHRRRYVGAGRRGEDVEGLDGGVRVDRAARVCDVGATKILESAVYAQPLHPTPYLLHPAPYDPMPHALHSTPGTFIPTPYSLHPICIHSLAKTLSPQQDLKPSILITQPQRC